MAVRDIKHQSTVRNRHTDVIHDEGDKKDREKPYVIIKCGTMEHVVARDDLCKFSKKLRKMSAGIPSSQEWEINVTSVPQNILQCLIDYIETSDPKIFHTLAKGTLFSVLSLAHSMEMTDIETTIISVLIMKSDSYSMIAYLWDLAQKYGNHEAVLEIIRYTEVNTLDMLNEGFFKAITWDQLCCLMNNFNHELPADNLCFAALQWLKVDPAKKQHSPIIARKIEWKKMSHAKICHLIFTEPLFRRMLKQSLTENLWSVPQTVTSALTQFHQSRMQSIHPVIPDTRTEASADDDTVNGRLQSYSMAWHNNMSVEQMIPMKSSVCYLRSTITNPAFLLVGATRNNSLAIQVYFVKTREWAEPMDISLQYRCYFGCSYHQQNLFILGGDRGDGFMFEECYSYHVFNYDLREICPFRHPRCKAGVVLSGTDLFVLGGLNEKQEAVSVALKCSIADRFEIWKPIKSMKERRLVPGVTVDPFGQVIVIGGHATTCEYYNKLGWVEMQSLPEPYSNYGVYAVYCRERVYAFRDFTPVEVCIFDLIKNDLKVVPTSGSSPDSIAGISCFGNEIWVITPKGRFYIYCVDGNVWKKTPLKSNDLCHFFYVTIIDQEDVRTFESKLEAKKRDDCRRQRV